MKETILVAIVALLGSGCRAYMLETRGDTIALARSSTEKGGRGGIIRYLKTGRESWRQARRKDAEARMEQFCSGPYTIAKEGPRSDFGPIGKSVSVTALDPNWYVEFDCAKPAEPTLLQRLP